MGLGRSRGALSLALLTVVTVLIVPRPADAIPAFARKYSFECTACHTAWPKLNAYGRDFKLSGYKIPGEMDDEELSQIVSDFQEWDKNLPVTALFKMRPYDKQKGKSSKIRAFHEAEVMIAGRAYKNLSVWTEFEAEDEVEFNVGVEQGVAIWTHTPGFNVAMGWAPVFWADPFEPLADGGRRMTRGHRGPLDQRFGSRERIRSSSQFISVYGKASGRVFYLGGVSSGGDDPEGGDDKDVFGRLMFEVSPGIYAGGFIEDGANAGADFTRYGGDAQIEQGPFNLYGMVMVAEDQTGAGGPKVSTTTGYVEGFYVIEPGSIPMIVPLVRLDFLDARTDLTANLGFYLAENWKAYAEYWANLDTPSGVKNNRFTVQIEFAF